MLFSARASNAKVSLSFEEFVMKFRLLIAAFAMIACYDVVDAQLPDDNVVYNSYLAFTPPTVDGVISPGEWDAAGDPYVFSFEPGGDTNFPEDPYGGDADLSFQFRTMWTPLWDVYFLVEITDDIAMDAAHDPGLNGVDRPWQRDQVELFVDGDELAGGEIRWWEEPIEPYGKFGVARTSDFEGNTGIMHEDAEEVLENSIVAAAVATETGDNGNYFVEYRVSLQPAFENGLFDETATGVFGTLVPDDSANGQPGTVVKFDLGISDNDNFEDDTNSNSGYYGLPRSDAGTEWYESNRYANLLFSNEFTGSSLDCDFDSNGTCDLDDIDALTVEAAPGDSTNPVFDLDGDGQVGNSDIAAWLQSAGPENGFSEFLYGDTDLNGTVDVTDLNIVGISWSNQDVNEWSLGNFGGSGVAADDLNRLALNWQQSSTPLAASQAAVPEPAGLTLMFIGLHACGLLRHRIRNE
jgi:hypothetical protein